MEARCGTRGRFTWGALASAVLSLALAVPALAAQLTLTWTDNATDELGFRIERRLNPSGSYSEVTTVGANVTSYPDTGVTAGQGYCYRVRAYNSAGDSGYSNEACGTAATPPSVTLTVAKVGTGTVTSTSPANAINCGADCAETVPSGTPITLSAAPGSGFVFAGWSGGGCSGTGTCTTPMTATATVTATFNTAPPPPTGGLVAAYSFDEGSGSTVADLSGQGNTGTISEATWSTQGRFNGALSFDGVNDFVDVGNQAALQLTGSMTVSAWINASAFPWDDAAIVSKRTSGQLGMQLDTTVDQGPRTIGFKLTNASGGSMFRYGATTLQLSTWYHVAGVYDASAQTLNVYLNGQLDNGALVGSITSTQQNSPSNVHIGQRPGIPGSFNFVGRIDEVRVHNRALSVSEISGAMNTGLGGGTPPPSVTLTVAKTGTGTVTSTTPANVISCGADCTETVASGTAITLSAAPGSGHVFSGWSGGGCSGTGGCTVTVSAATTVTATFTPTVTLTVAKTGTGTVTSTTPANVISCGGDCTETVASGTAITLSAAPGSGHVFSGWSGGGCSGTGGCTTPMTATATVTATFTPTVTLTVAKTGTGTVTSTTPANVISCGGDCTETVASGTAITLSAAPGSGHVFSGWSGGGCSGTGGCTTPMTATATVTATFTPTVTLTVAKTGTGTVTSTTPANVISCGGDCTETVASGTAITLSAAAGSGHVFAGWSGGGCSGTGSCTVTVSAATTVTATFTPTVTLTVAKTGTGTVTSTTPANVIDCGADCTETVPSGTAITLTAAAGSGHVFSGWSGGGCSGTGSCTVTVSAATTVTATFTPTVTLTVAKTGTGTVTSTSPANVINCGVDCTETVPSGTAITLSAAAGSGHVFSGWSGGGCSGTGSCTVTVSAATTVTATFTPTVTLTVSKTGTGTVTSTTPVNVINCGADCTETVPSGTAITLSAAAGSGHVFAGWSGGGCSGTGGCTVTVSAATTVTATFTPTVTLTVAKTGTGTVTSTTPANVINCGGDCTETVPSGTAITLSAAAGSGHVFAGWSGGGCSGTGGCTTPMTATATVTATFTPTVTLTVARTGTGTVTSTTPANVIDCGADCTETVPSGTAITLSAAAGSGHVFSGWSGGGCSGTGGCTTPMTATATVTATFTPTVTLTVARTGTGTVTSTTPANVINCGADCTETVPSGTAITLAAAAGSGHVFTGWSGGGCSGTGGCTTPMTATATVTATFTPTVTLTVAKTGTGTVTSTSPANVINCGGDCTETVPSGTAITLAAAPGSGHVFSGWSGGGCSGTGGCTVTVSAATTVTATFTPTVTLTVAKTGTGTVTSTSPANVINCGGDCTETVPSGTAITLSAAPGSGHVFAGWSGGGCSGTGGCTTPMTATATVTATFTPTVTLTVARTGTGTVTSTTPANVIDCGADCTETVPSGTAITLAAAPGSDHVFSGWSGGGCSGTGGCTVTVSAAITVTATFTPTVTLTVAKTGTGTVTSTTPANVINCGADCTETVPSGTAITLSAAPGSGHVFSGWSGGGCSGTGGCTVTVSAAITVTATFTPTVTLTVAKTGTGTVTSTTPANVINCGADCTETVPSGTAITLSAAAGSGHVFSGWSGGGCSGAGGCTTPMTATATVTATFTPTVTLTVAKTGTGTVTSTTPANVINCGADCTETVPSGTAITLSATAGSGHVFAGWSGGGCSGAGGCTTPMTATATVTATFTPTVTLTVARTGTGTVTSTTPANVIDCGADCTETVPSGTAITLAAAAGSGQVFTGWSGGGCSGTGGCTTPMTATATVTATFTPTVTLTVAKAGTGTVTSTSPANVINCGADCTETVPSGTAITLSAAASSGHVFSGWSGGGCSGTGGCTTPMTATATVTATFTPTVTLTVAKAGTGTVTSTSPANVINCGADCTETVPSGTAITLAAAPGNGHVFAGWSGGACSGTGSCTTPMTATATVTATFTPTVTLTVAKTGTGTVTSTTPASVINCGADCTETVPSGTAITLSAAPGSGHVFSGWSGGGCSGTGSCTVTVSAATTVTATFTPTVTLTVAKTGTGTVTSTSPANVIDCGADCTETVPSGTAITLAAVPGSGSSFTGWSGGGCSGTGGCTTPMIATATVTASFSSPPLLQFSLANYSVSEVGPTATITVTRSGPALAATVDYATSDGSAVHPTDYTVTAGTLTFAANQTTRTFVVPVPNNTLADGPRTVLLQLSNPQNAQLGARATAVLTIQDNDGGGALKFSATGYTYPDKPGYATITVSRSSGSASGASVQYWTGTGTAVAGTDYTAISAPQSLTFLAGETSKTFKVYVTGNSTAGDSSKTVSLHLGNASGGATLSSPTVATLTLTNDDTGGGLKLGASSYSVAESAPHATATVTRSGGAASGITVQVLAVAGTAKAGLDYGAPTPSALTFAAGESSKTVDVPLIANPLATGSRSLTLKLQSPGGGATLSWPSTAPLTITKVGVRFSQTAYTVNEGPGSASITVTRTGSTGVATVQIQTLDDSAVAPADYTPLSQTLTFSNGQTSKTVTVAIPDNPSTSANRTLRLQLLNATGTALGTPNQATLTILDKGAAELQLTAFTPPAAGLAGKTIAVLNTVRNLSAKTAPASTLRFVVSPDAVLDAPNDGQPDNDVLLGTRGVPSLGAGASSAATTTLTLPGTLAPGAYTLFALVDAANVVPEQDEGNNVGAAPLTVVANLVRTFGVAGVVTNDGCTSPLRNGRATVLGSLAVWSQTGTALTGTLTLTYPLTAGLKTTGSFTGTVGPDGQLGGPFPYTTKQGSTTVSSGTGTLTGTVNGATLEVELTGQSASGETCDLTGWLVSPAVPVTFMSFHHHATAGPLDELGGEFVATPSFPATLERYRVLFQVAGDTAPFPAAATVLFTGPPGSQLADTPGAELSQLATNAAEYRSPWVSAPPIAPAGDWTEEYEGYYYDYAMADPQAEARLVVPVPTFAQSNGSLTRVDWTYRAGDGTALGGPPAFMRLIRLQVLDPCGLVLHDSLPLAPTTLSRVLNPALTLSRVAEVRFQYVDDGEHHYTVRYGGATPGTCKMVEFSAPSFSAGESVSQATITVRRAGDLTGTVTVNFTTSNGTAQQGLDYTYASQLVTLGPNVTSTVVGVQILNNGLPQNPRTVLLGLNGPTGGAALGPLNTAVLTINDDDPRIRFSSPTYTVSEGSTSATITVQRTGATAPVVSVPYATANGTALAGFDYAATAGVLTFASGQTSKTFTVPILGDVLAEGGQTVQLLLGTPTGAWLATPDTATLTITDNDTGGTLAFAAPTFSVAEDGSAVTITVVRTGGTGAGVTVQYATSNGTGQAGTDYDITSGTLTFGANETSKTFTVPVHVNAGSSANKSVTLTLSTPSPGATLGSPKTATLWIVDGN